MQVQGDPPGIKRNRPTVSGTTFATYRSSGNVPFDYYSNLRPNHSPREVSSDRHAPIQVVPNGDTPCFRNVEFSAILRTRRKQNIPKWGMCTNFNHTQIYRLRSPESQHFFETRWRERFPAPLGDLRIAINTPSTLSKARQRPSAVAEWTKRFRGTLSAVNGRNVRLRQPTSNK